VRCFIYLAEETSGEFPNKPQVLKISKDFRTFYFYHPWI